MEYHNENVPISSSRVTVWDVFCFCLYLSAAITSAIVVLMSQVQWTWFAAFAVWLLFSACQGFAIYLKLHSEQPQEEQE